MKATAIAATAILLGSAAADGWNPWDPSSADPVDDPKTPVMDKTTTPVEEETSTWSAWTSSNTPVEDTTSSDPSTWSEWTATTSSKPVEVISTTSADPHTWSAWASTTSTPVKATSTSTDPEHTWSEWATTSTSTDPEHTWSEWASTSTSSDPAHTWSEWETSSTPAAVTSTGSVTWSAWDPKETLTSTSTQWITVTVYDNGDKSDSWSVWSTPAVATSTGVASSWSAWSATPAVPAASTLDGCKMEVSVSYGPPVWYPTPAVATAENTTTWSVWEPATTSKPVVPTTTASQAASTWSAWTQSAGGQFYSKPESSNNAGWSKSSVGISANGNKFGMTYSAYNADSSCKDAATVSADIAKMAAKGFTSVRVYSTDCSTLENVGSAAKANGMKVILGVFISDTGISGAQPQVDKIAEWKQWDLVELIVVGNEAVFNNRCSASELAGFIGSAKSAFQAAGYKGAVSTTDELSIWQGQGAAWCDVVDVVTANLYAFFNPNTKAEDAGDFINSQIQDLSTVCPGKDVYVMESGWPSAGECNGAACPSPENQAVAIKGIEQAVGAKVVFFSFEDEQWKQPGQFGVEQHWGCGDVFN